MRRLLFFVTFIGVSLGAFSQRHYSVERIIEKIFDYVTDELEVEPDYDALYETLYYYSEHPINLNSATKEELEQLQFLSDIQIENLLFYCYQYGPMKTIYELALVEQMDRFTIEFLLPFVTVETQSLDAKWELKSLLKYGYHDIITRFDGTVETKQGYLNNTLETLEENPNSHYVGSPFYTSFKYRFQAKDKIQAGLTAEKDAGEQFWGSQNKGFDSYSGYLQLNDLWRFSRVVVGDYRATFGQGLLMNGSFAVPKSSQITNVMPRTHGLTRKASTDEYGFLRGAGATLKLSHWELTAFYSLRQLDGDTTGGSFPSLKTDGLHRTISDNNRKHTITTQSFGANALFRHRIFRLGLTAVHTSFSLPMQPANEPHNTFAFAGKSQTGASFDYLLRLRGITFFGETAINQEAAFATLNGVSLSPISIINLVLLHRYYSPKYDMLYARAFAKQSNVGNENGIYTALELFLAKGWKISAYGDAYRFPWYRYNVSAPSIGYDAFLQLDYHVNQHVNMCLRGKYESIDHNERNELPTIQVEQRQKMSMRYLINYQIAAFNFRSCIELNAASLPAMPATTGVLLYQDIGYTSPKNHLTIRLRYALFDAINYENRFYSYEHDVPYMFTSGMLYGVGSRYYLNIGYRIKRSWVIYLRWAQTIYADNRSTIGSGREQITGNVKSDFRIHLQWRLHAYR